MSRPKITQRTLDFGHWTWNRNVRMPRILSPAKSLIMNRRLLLAALLLASMALSFVGEGNAGSTRASTAKKTIRVMTFNIHVGVGMDKKLDLQRIADVINREQPDLVGLQEVDRGVKRTEGKDEIAELAEMTPVSYTH